eukprot:g2280.t1
MHQDEDGATILASRQNFTVCIDIRLPDSFSPLISSLVDGMRLSHLHIEVQHIKATNFQQYHRRLIFVSAAHCLHQLLLQIQKDHPQEYSRLQSFEGSALEQQAIMTLLRHLPVAAGDIAMKDTPGHFTLQPGPPILGQLEKHLCRIKDRHGRGITMTALHHAAEREELLTNWCSFEFLRNGLFNGTSVNACRAVCRYFGPRIGFYFAWLTHFSYFLAPLALVGMMLFAYQVVHDEVDTPWIIPYTTIVMLWAACFSRKWRRRYAELTVLWHDGVPPSSMFEASELDAAAAKATAAAALHLRGHGAKMGHTSSTVPRRKLLKHMVHKLSDAHNRGSEALTCGAPGEELALDRTGRARVRREYTPLYHKDSNGQLKEVNPGLFYSLLYRLRIAVPVMVLSIGVIFWCAWAVVRFGDHVTGLYSECFREHAGTLELGAATCYAARLGPAVLNLVMTKVLNSAFYPVAERVTVWENHRTQEAYARWLELKLFFFQIISYFSVLFYFAFGRRDLPRLRSYLMVSMVVDAVIGNVLESIVPAVSGGRRDLTNIDKNVNTKNLSRLALQCEMPEFTSTDIFYDYAEIVCQFGFVTFFAAAFPLAPALAMFNNAIEVRTDAMKLLRGHKRPMAERIDDLLMWNEVIDFVCLFSVFTNCALLAVSSSAFDKAAANGNLWLFGIEKLDTLQKIVAVVAIEHLVLVLQRCIELFMPAMPLRVKKAAMQREQERTMQTHIGGVHEGIEFANHRHKLTQDLKGVLSTESSKDKSNQLGGTDKAGGNTNVRGI